jgi:hypothetical protein
MKGTLPGAPRPRLPPCRSPPQTGVIEFDDRRHRLAVIAFLHDLHQLLLHAPIGFAANPRLAFQLYKSDKQSPFLELNLILGHDALLVGRPHFECSPLRLDRKPAQ